MMAPEGERDKKKERKNGTATRRRVEELIIALKLHLDGMYIYICVYFFLHGCLGGKG